MKCRIAKSSDSRKRSIQRGEVSRIGETGDVRVAGGIKRQVQRAFVFAPADISEINEIGSVVREFCNKGVAVESPTIEICVETNEGEGPFPRKGFARNVNEPA